MDMDPWYGWYGTYAAKLPHFLWALIVLLIGWIVAKAIGKAVEKLMRKTNWDEKIFRSHSDMYPADAPNTAQAEGTAGRPAPGAKRLDTNELVGKIVYYLLLLFVFIIFFNMLNLSTITSPFIGMFGTMAGFIPAVLKAALILLLAWVIAYFLRMLVFKLGQKPAVTGFLQRIKVADTEEEGRKYVVQAGNLVFYLILLLFLPGILSSLNIGGVAEPFSRMFANVLLFLPKLAAAALIFIVGLFVAKLVRSILTGFLQTIGTEGLAQRLGIKQLLGRNSLSSIIGMIAFILIMIPVVISALDQLDIRALTDPAVGMLEQIFGLIPNIIVAVALILFGVWLGKWVRQMVAALLRRTGFDSLTRNMAVGSWRPGAGAMALSEVVGYIAQILIVFFLTVEALNLVKLDFLVVMATAITAYLPNVLAAVIILVLGVVIGNFVEKVLSSILSGPSFKAITAVAKYAVIALSLFMALDQLGVAASIVNSAFILILGGLALAFGLAFGLGGREFAGRYLAKLDRTIEETEVDTSKMPSPPPPMESMNPNRNPGTHGVDPGASHIDQRTQSVSGNNEQYAGRNGQMGQDQNEKKKKPQDKTPKDKGDMGTTQDPSPFQGMNPSIDDMDRSEDNEKRINPDEER